MWERDFDLHLLPTGHAPMKRPTMIQHMLNHPMVLVINRPGEFSRNQIVRNIAEKLEVRKTSKKVKREKQVSGHPIAMSLDENRNLRLFGQPSPTLQKRDA